MPKKGKGKKGGALRRPAPGAAGAGPSSSGGGGASAGPGRGSAAEQPQTAQPLSAAAPAERLRALAAAGNLEGIEQLLRQHPGVLNAARIETGAVTALMFAACHGHTACVAALLTAGADVNAADSRGMSALQLAVGVGHLGCVAALLEGSADPNAADRTGDTAVHLAVQNGEVECLDALLSAGGDPAARNGSGDTPLHCCCASEKAAFCAPALLAAGANPSCSDGGGQTALHRVMQRRHLQDVGLDLIQVLLAAGANPNAQDNERRMPLHVAARHGAPFNWVHALVLGGASLDSADATGRTPLQVAHPEGDDDFISAVLRAVEDQARELDECGIFEAPTPLYRAVACDQPGVLRAHLAKGHSPHVAALRSGATPLALAAELGHDSCIRELLATSADPNAADRAGNTAAFYAAEAGDWHRLRRVLAANASAEAPCEMGRTPLHVAAERGHEACMIALLEAGADVTAVDEEGFTPLQLAAIAGQVHCVWTLLMAGSSLPSFDFQAGADQLHADAAALIQQAAVQLGLLPDPAHGAGAAGGRAAAATPAGAALDDALLRSEVCCPITHEIMEEPVIAADGTTYEKHAIETWIARQQAAGQPPTSPVTNLPLEHTTLTDNRIAKALTTSLQAAGLLS